MRVDLEKKREDVLSALDNFFTSLKDVAESIKRGEAELIDMEIDYSCSAIDSVDVVGLPIKVPSERYIQFTFCAKEIKK